MKNVPSFQAFNLACLANFLENLDISLQVRGCQTLIDPRSWTQTPKPEPGFFNLARAVWFYKRGARLQWQSQPRVLGGNPIHADIEQVAKRQASAGIETNLSRR